MKKALTLILAMAMAASFAACNGASAPPASSAAPSGAAPAEAAESGGEKAPAAEPTGDGPVINFWNGFTGSDGEILTDIVNRYNDGNEKGISVKMDIIPWANFHEKLPTAVATGTAPQMVLNGNDMLATYYNNDAFLEVADFFEVTGTDKANFNQASLDLFTLDGKLLGIPMQVNGMYLYWNKDHFTEAGLDPETPPRTWEELGEMAVKTTNAEKNVYGFGVASGFSTPEHVIMGNGGIVVDDENRKSGLDSQAAIDSMAFLQNLTYTNKVSPPATPGADMDNLMFAGQLAMYINGPWMNNGLQRNEINYGVTTIPAGSAGQKGTLGGCHFGVTSGVSDQDKLAAYDFIAYWNTTEICKEWSLKNGFPPYLATVAEDPEVSADPIVSELYKALAYATPTYRGVTVTTRINDDILTPLAEGILYNGDDPAVKIPEASAKIDELLK